VRIGEVATDFIFGKPVGLVDAIFWGRGLLAHGLTVLQSTIEIKSMVLLEAPPMARTAIARRGSAKDIHSQEIRVTSTAHP